MHEPLTDNKIASRYYTRGKTLTLVSEPKTVYLGLPELWCDQEKIAAPLLVKLNNADTWQTVTVQTQGVYQLAWQDTQGKLIFQTQCALLPENFTIQAHADNHTIDIMHSGRAYISCPSPLVTGIHTLGDGRSIGFAADTLPNEVDVIFRWSGNNEHLIITVPFSTPISHNTIKSITDIKTIADALAIENTKLRLLFIRHLLKQLSRNFTNPDWQHVLKIPLTATEFWSIAIQEPRVLVALVIELELPVLLQLTDLMSITWEIIPLRDWLAIFSRYKNHLALVLTDTMLKVQINKHIEKLHALTPCLNVVEQLLKYQLFAIADEELLFMQSEEAALLITEQLTDEQQQLIVRQKNKPYPNELKNELLAAWQRVPNQTQALVSNISELNAVTLLPLVLVHFALTSTFAAWQNSPKLSQLKAFDERWFDTAYTLSLAYLSQQPYYALALEQETAAMIDHDENDLVSEIEQQLALANQEVQGLQTDIQSLAGGQEALEALLTENQQLNAEIENLSNIIKKRDAALRVLLEEVKKLNAKIQEIRTELQGQD